MPTANNGWAARFMAADTKDIKSVHVNFSSVSSPGTVEARIETIDSNGKPTGTLYDANATKTFTPTADWNTVTFDTLPTTGLTAGTLYALVLLKSDTGTTCTLRGRVGIGEGVLPTAFLSASDISTRSNFAETAGAVPVAYFTMDDDTVRSHGCCVSVDATTAGFVYGADRVQAAKIVIPSQVTPTAIFMIGNGIARTGTPAGDLRVRILDASNNAVANTTFTLPIGAMTNSSGRSIYLPLSGVTLAAGTYRIAFDSASSANGSNSWGMRYATLPTADLQDSSIAMSESTDASTSFTWTDYADRAPTIGLLINDIAGGSSNPLIQKRLQTIGV